MLKIPMMYGCTLYHPFKYVYIHRNWLLADNNCQKLRLNLTYLYRTLGGEQNC